MLQELNERYEVIALSSPDEYLDNVRQREGVRCIEVPMERQISLFKDIVSLWRLYRIFLKERPHMVHSLTPKAGLLCMAAGWLARVPVRIHTFTGLVFPTARGLKKQILMATDRLTCACATHIIPEGEGVKNDLLNNGITNNPLKVLGYGNIRGIDLDVYNPDLVEAQQLPDDEVTAPSVTFISVGRLVGDKGINELVEAFVRLNGECSNSRLILVGPEEQNLDPLRLETLNAIKTNSSIHAVGFQKDIRPWMKSSDVAILASYREGFPNVVIEAGAMGLPQIVTDINGAREIVVDGENGLIVPPHDADSLYRAMKRLMSAEERSKLSDKAREMIATRFEQGFVRKCLYDFYSEVL